MNSFENTFNDSTILLLFEYDLSFNRICTHKKKIVHSKAGASSLEYQEAEMDRLCMTAASAAIFIIYWVACLGKELVQLIHSPTLGSVVLNQAQLQTKFPSHLRGGAAAETNHHLLASLSTQYAAFESASRNNTTTVPKILHRMWRDENIPNEWRSSHLSCEDLYKERNWTTILWTDAAIRSFLSTHYAFFLPTYNSYPYDIQRVDAARYFILYHYGGVYLDLDIGCRDNKDLIDLVRAMESMQMKSMFPLTEPIGVSNDVMFATKGNAFFKELIETLPERNRWYGLPYFTVLFSTGPMFLSLACIKHHQTNVQDVAVLSPALYSNSGARFFRHLKGSTWHTIDAIVVKLVLNNWLTVFATLIIVTIMRQRRRKDKHPAIKPHRLSV
ncbi:hypothetical protein ACHAXN_006089 [Cyclotella atomus]